MRADFFQSLALIVDEWGKHLSINSQMTRQVLVMAVLVQ
jgi:hypothetical protein